LGRSRNPHTDFQGAPRVMFSLPSEPFPNLTEKYRLSSRFTHHFHAWWLRICQATSPLLCITSTHSTQHSCGTILRTACECQTRLKASRSSCTSLSRRSSILCPTLPARASLAYLSTREHWESWSMLWCNGLR
jgi:hypothetical protein